MNQSPSPRFSSLLGRPSCPLLLLLLVALTGTVAQSEELELTISELQVPTGTVNWALYDSAEAYERGEDDVVSARQRVHGERLRVTPHDLPAGRYALRLFHDENNNGELDTNMLGIPKEGYGFSNNAGARGPASFEDAAFDLLGRTELEVRVR